ncbi:hypothetical protein PHJA_002400800 [Phtheirospermum japonicum]|uniref:GCK domain-containing protein n=1 Tax=Phtheirospermum japonicum TaxID=374723 RepID=A0A830CPU5_9LAMI|nr:hypothetical protein PHJA_002400800 [Phtheirospermum japonicum]
MSSPNPDQPNSKTLEPQIPIEKIPDPPTDPNTAQIQSEEKPNETIKDGNNNEEEDEEEEGECGFCLFMKGGGCKETFTEWEKCVEEGEKNEEDIVGKCYQATANLKKCMEEHSDYYAPLLQAEKAAEAEAAKQLEEERESSNKEEESGEKGKDENLGVSDEKQSS